MHDLPHNRVFKGFAVTAFIIVIGAIRITACVHIIVFITGKFTAADEKLNIILVLRQLDAGGSGIA